MGVVPTNFHGQVLDVDQTTAEEKIINDLYAAGLPAKSHVPVSTVRLASAPIHSSTL